MSGQLRAGPPPLTQQAPLPPPLSLAARCSAGGDLQRLMSINRQWQGLAARQPGAAAARGLRPVYRELRQPVWQRSGFAAGVSGSSGSGGEQADGVPSEGDAAAAASSERPVLVKRFKSGKPEWVPVTAELTASLAPLAELCGADLVTVAAAAASQPDFRQQELMRNGLQVAAHLQGLGVEQPQLACLLERCPELFSWPVEERAGVLFGQLMGQGLSAAEAGRCFEQYPGAITSPGFKPAIGVLAELLASGSKEGQAGRQLLADLLRKQPSALALVSSTASTLRKHADNLLNELGLSPQQLVAAVQRSWPLLNRSTKHLAALEAVLQRELGANRSLFRKILVKVPRAVNCSLETVQRRVQALVAELGQEQVLRAVDKAPGLLSINTVVWQRALAVMRQCGVADPIAVALNSVQMLCQDFLAPARLANRLALQRCLGLSAAGVYEQFGSYVANSAAEKLAGRLLYLEQRGLLHLLMADKRAARRAWQEERGLPANETAAGEPTFISVRELAILPDTDFSSLKALRDGAADFAAFTGVLKGSPAWAQLWGEAQAEAELLTSLLPPELQPGAAPAASSDHE